MKLFLMSIMAFGFVGCGPNHETVHLPQQCPKIDWEKVEGATIKIGVKKNGCQILEITMPKGEPIDLEPIEPDGEDDNV